MNSLDTAVWILRSSPCYIFSRRKWNPNFNPLLFSSTWIRITKIKKAVSNFTEAWSTPIIIFFFLIYPRNPYNPETNFENILARLKLVRVYILIKPPAL